MAQIGVDIGRAEEILRQGGLVAIPTETVYGLAGNALKESSVSKIFKAKNRPSFDPLIVHTNALHKVESFVRYIPDQAIQLAKQFWPGPLTLLLQKKSIVPDLVTSGLDSVAVRIPNHELTLSLLAQLEFPLAAPSANPFGYVSPTTAEHVEAQLGHTVDYILDGGACQVGVESTIVSFLEEKPKVLRLGGLAVEQIEEVIGSVRVNKHSSSSPQAPGMLKSHYAPGKSIVWIDGFNWKAANDFSQIGAIVFQHPLEELPLENQFVLSAKGDLEEAARNLFTALRTMDKNNHIALILTQRVPDVGLGRAINDRLKRATAK
ncbi:MAG: L-threonylcarbamoyladenylate synthase [Bacteroidota bacterium]|nr:L-threonylcarbamoyladenylate synthase [Bacteroidota bacterium]